MTSQRSPTTGCAASSSTASGAVYERHGVPEYWVVDLERDEVLVHRIDQGRYLDAGLTRRGDTLSSPQLPGLELLVDDLFGE